MIHYSRFDTKEFVRDYDVDHVILWSNRNIMRAPQIGDKVYTENFCYTLKTIDYMHKKPFYMWEKERISSVDWRKYRDKFKGLNTVYEEVSRMKLPEGFVRLCPINNETEVLYIKPEAQRVKRGRKGRI